MLVTSSEKVNTIVCRNVPPFPCPAFHPGLRNIEVACIPVMFPRGRSRLGNASAAATMHVAVQVIGLTLVRSGGEDGSEEGAIEERILVITARRADAVRARRRRIKRTTTQVAGWCDVQEVIPRPAGRRPVRPLCSMNPKPSRPDGVTFRVAVMPLAIMVPPLPSEMPWRISQVAPNDIGARQD